MEAVSFLRNIGDFLSECNASHARRSVLFIESFTVNSENCSLNDQALNTGSENIGFESQVFLYSKFERGFAYGFEANVGRIVLW
jgi:hypothetical protein